MSRYYEVEGKQLPSVTTILGKMLVKEALVPWAAKEVATSFENQLAQQYYNPVLCIYEIPETELPDIIKIAKGSYRAKSTEAMAKGTIVHDIIEQYVKSDCQLSPDTIDCPVAKQGLQQFIQWGDDNEIEILEIEQQVSYKDLYAGRYDMLARVNGTLTLVDFKTSTGIYEPEMPLQLHAYASCLDKQPYMVAILRLDKNTGEIEYKDWIFEPKIANVFISMAEAYNTLFPYKETKKKKEK